MKLFLDLNLPAGLSSALEGPVFDVVDTRLLGMQRSDDVEIVDYAASDGRIIVSADTDFGAILAARGSSKPSFVLLRRSRGLAAEETAAVLTSNLPAYADELATRAWRGFHPPGVSRPCGTCGAWSAG